MIETISKNVNELMDFMTQKDCKDLKELIISNPEAPLLIFAGEEAWNGDYGYECAGVGSVELKEVTLYEGTWLDIDYYEDSIRDSMGFDDQYENLSDEEFEKEVDKIIAETAFIKAIVVYVG